MMDEKKIGVGAGVMMMKDGKVLLGRRHDDPNKADSELHGEGTWTMPGGKMHFGETFEECALREVREETGIILNDMNIIGVNNDKKGEKHFITIRLFSDNFSGEPKIMEPDEITEWRWFELDKLPEKIFFPSAKILENYKQKKFYIKCL
jgi:8-oxo-dGTP diphosphatase